MRRGRLVRRGRRRHGLRVRLQQLLVALSCVLFLRSRRIDSVSKYVGSQTFAAMASAEQEGILFGGALAEKQPARQCLVVRGRQTLHVTDSCVTRHMCVEIAHQWSALQHQKFLFGQRAIIQDAAHQR